MKFAILVTNDYEVLGDGRGDIRSMVIQPTSEMLDLVEEYARKLTLFVDIVEYWRFREAEHGRWFSSSYRAASLIEEQLKDAVDRGHDVQLHVHPQWLAATPVNEHEWVVDNRYWRTPLVPGGLGDRDNRTSLRGLMNQGKKTLEGLLNTVKPDYRCVAFRAGGYCIQPEADVLQAMREAGLRVDSSVCPGRFHQRRPAYYDYRNAPSTLAYWQISDCVIKPDPAGDLMELPVATAREVPIPKHLIRFRPLRTRIRRRLKPRIINLDYCKSSSAELIGMTKDYIERVAKDVVDEVPVPLVLIGHSKEWTGRDELTAYLQWVAEADDTVFMTISEWLARYDKFRNEEVEKSV